MAVKHPQLHVVQEEARTSDVPSRTAPAVLVGDLPPEEAAQQQATPAMGRQSFEELMVQAGLRRGLSQHGGAAAAERRRLAVLPTQSGKCYEQARS